MTKPLHTHRDASHKITSEGFLDSSLLKTDFTNLPRTSYYCSARHFCRRAP